MKERRSERGSALIYILIAIALLAALTATFMDSSSQQTTSQNTFNTVTDLNTQINFIRSSIQECVLTYPNGATDALATTTYNSPYPINPTSAYFTAPAGTNAASLLKCPGNPQSADPKDQAVVFGGSSGKFLPPQPKLFTAWNYYNGVDGVFFYTGTSNSDSYLNTSLTKLDDQYSECEADVIDNSAGGSAMNITSSGGSGPNCPANTICFRVWMIANTSNIYPGDTGADEAGCP